MRLTDIRRATPGDIDAGIAMVSACYPNRDLLKMRPWIEWLLTNPHRAVFIGAHSVGACQFSWNYGTEPRARLDFLAARSMAYAVLEPLRMVRLMLEWAREKGARGSFRMDADTGVDFGPFARRLGGCERSIRVWDIPLE